MINIDYTLLVQAAVFIAFVFLINRLVYHPVLRALEKRREATIGAQEKAISLQEKAREEMALLEQELAQARQNAAREREQIRNKVLQEHRSILARSREKIERDIPALREEMWKDLKGVEQNLKSEIEPFARRMAEKVLGRGIE